MVHRYRFASSNKLEIFRQAVMQATDIVNHPERVNTTFFCFECALHPNHENRASVDKYLLKSAIMRPLEEGVLPGVMGDMNFPQYLKVQDDLVKSRGQIGVIAVLMQDATDPDDVTNQWWPLAIPYSTKVAQEMLEDAKWGNVWWVSVSIRLVINQLKDA
jgi:hypothetical protein